MAKKNWIQDAINPAHKGVFTQKAKKQGKTVAGYAKQVTSPKSTADITTKRQGALAKTLSKISKNK
jgi:hypothetical protein